MPSVRIVDLRREAGYPLSAPLLAELGTISEHGGKAILLLNRRGVAPAIHCRACGLSRRCGLCDVSLTLHGDARLHCHHCGYSEAVPEACPACGSAELARIGAGTQRLEAELAKRVPELERIRLDADTAAKPGALREALDRFAAADRAVLIGTQMVAKGHHFPGVALAAVVDADTGLALPDFRAEERTFQLVTQLAGRSGRDAPGKVIVQTFQPDATPLRYAARHDVAGFLAEELDAPARARLSALPPPDLDRRLRRRRGRAGAAAARAEPAARTAPSCSARRRCSACADATARSSSPRPTARARSPRAPGSCSPPRRRRCAGPASTRSSTSTRSRSSATADSARYGELEWRKRRAPGRRGGRGGRGDDELDAQAAGAPPRRARADPPVPGRRPADAGEGGRALRRRPRCGWPTGWRT